MLGSFAIGHLVVLVLISYFSFPYPRLCCLWSLILFSFSWRLRLTLLPMVLFLLASNLYFNSIMMVLCVFGWRETVHHGQHSRRSLGCEAGSREPRLEGRGRLQPQSPSPGDSLLRLGPTSWGFHSLLKQHHSLGIRNPNTQAYGEHLAFNSSHTIYLWVLVLLDGLMLYEAV